MRSTSCLPIAITATAAGHHGQDHEPVVVTRIEGSSLSARRIVFSQIAIATIRSGLTTIRTSQASLGLDPRRGNATLQPTMAGGEAFSRVKIDAQLTDVGWSLTSDQERLLRMIGEQIKANATTLESFETVQFVNPPFSFRGGLDWAIRAFGGSELVEQKLEDLNRAVFREPEEHAVL